MDDKTKKAFTRALLFLMEIEERRSVGAFEIPPPRQAENRRARELIAELRNILAGDPAV